MPALDIITLVVNGTEYRGWQSISVNDSIGSAASSFQLSVTERWQRNDGYQRQLIHWKLKSGDSCVVKVAGETLITGYIDVHNPAISATSHTVRVSGRSKTADLIDCSAVHSPGNFHDQTTLQIASAIASPFGISVEMGGGASPALVEKFELDNGETAFESIERLCRKHQLLITPTREGNLQLTYADKSAYGFVLSHWIEASVTSDYSQRFSEYRAKGQRHGYDEIDPLKSSRVYKQTDVSGVGRYRPKIVRPEGTTTDADAQKRIDWQASRDLGDSLKMDITLLGFRTPGNAGTGSIWQKNKRVAVSSEELGVGQQLLIESVSFEKSAQGTFTRLSLVHPHAYAPEPPSPGKAGGTAKSGYFS